MKKYILLIILAVSVVYPQMNGSSWNSDARTMALGGIGAVSSPGIRSFGNNPANLVFSRGKSTEMVLPLPLPNASVVSGNNFMSISDFNYYFGATDSTNNEGKKVGRYLTEADIQRLQDMIEEGNNVFASVNINWLSFVYHSTPAAGSFGFSINDIVAMDLAIPKNLIKLMPGNELETLYDFNDTKMQAWGLREYSLSYARDVSEIFSGFFESFSAGVRLKYISGFAYMGLENINTSFSVNGSYEFQAKSKLKAVTALSPDFGVKYNFDESTGNRESNIGPFPEPAGSGMGFDIGFTAVLDSVWAFGISINDIGSIKWDKETVAYEADTRFTIKGFNDKDLTDSLFNTLEPEGRYTEAFTTSLPSSLNLGAEFQLDKFLDGEFPGEMLILLQYSQGFNEVPGNTVKPRAAIGIDWMPANWFAFRNGFSFGGYDKFRWSSGIGFITGSTEIDMTVSHVNGLILGNDLKALGLTCGMAWYF